MSGAKRFGGAYSPGGAPQTGSTAPRVAPPARPWAGRAATSVSLRALGLYLFATPLLVGALWSLLSMDVVRLSLFIAAYAALLVGAKLTREGLKAEAAFAARAVARPPAWPRKLMGGVAVGLGVAGATWLGGGGPVGAGGFAALAFGLHLVAFGPDPMRSKGLEGLSGEALDAAVTRIETARRLVAEMTEAAARFGQPALTAQAQGLAQSALGVIAKLERNPGDMRRARRFLAVYLVGARDATVGFAQTWAENPYPEIAARYGALIDDMTGHFQRTEAMLGENDRAALDVEIDVLRERLKMEGV